MREDNRDRDDADAQKDMFGRMCNSFFEDLNDKLKQFYVNTSQTVNTD